MSHSDLDVVLENMTEDDLAQFLVSLDVYAERLLRRHGPRARHYGFTATDVVHEAFMLALAKKRTWPEELPLYVFFTGIIKSIIGHLAERPEHQKRVSIDGGHDHDEESPGSVADIASDEDVEAEALAQIALQEFKERLGRELSDYIDDLIEEAGSTAEELAKKRGKTVKEIRNDDRKLARRRAQWNPR